MNIFQNLTQNNQYILIGDPTISGWLITIAYLMAAFLAFHKYQQYKKMAEPVVFWGAIAVFLLFMGLNKQLDLQTLFLTAFKDISKSHGWYAQRKAMQVGFVVMLGFCLLMTLIIARIKLIESWISHKLIWFGLVILSIFILLRVASFNKLATASWQIIGGFDIHSILELLAIVFIIYGIYVNKAVESISKKTIVAKQEGDDVFCPKCARLASNTALNGRVFKCKYCSHKYKVTINQ